ncbi:MAG: alpha/beta fold hydrolase [Pseudomonadota bacterium]
MRFRLALLLLAALAAPGAAAPQPAGLYAKSFGTTAPRRARTLIVVLHGDAPAARPGYHYDFARAAAAAVPNSVAVGLLRPGYEDPAGKRSPGVRGTTTGDNYTPDRVAAVAAAIRKLQRRYRSARTILVGHSGGAAITADLAGTYPGLIDGMILVSCPCALPEWRRHMKTVAPTPLWDQPVASLDPIMLVGGIPAKLKTAVLVGSDDRTTPIAFSRAYAEALTLRGIATDYRIVPGKDHELLGDAQVLDALRRMAAALPGKR